MTAVSTPDSLRTQPMSGSISPQAQDGAVNHEITAGYDYYNNNLENKLFYGDDDGFSSYNTNNKYITAGKISASIIGNPSVVTTTYPSSKDSFSFNAKKYDDPKKFIPSTEKQVQTMLGLKNSDMIYRKALNALKDKGYTAFLQPNKYSNGNNDKFLLTYMDPNTFRMEEVSTQEHLQQLLA